MAIPNEKKSVWSDLPRRLTTIGIGVPLFWWLLQKSWLAFTLFTGVHALAAMEYSQLIRQYQQHQHQQKQQQHPTSTSQPFPFSLMSSWYFFPLLSLAIATVRDDALFHLLLVVTSALLFLWTETFLFDASQQPVKENKHELVATPYQQLTTPTALYYHYLQGFVHLTIPFHAWYELCRQATPFCHYHTISLLLIVWNCDNGALICGRLFGKRQPLQQQPKWLLRISPSKSMVGLVGGWFGGLITTVWLPSFWSILHSTALRQEYEFYWDDSSLVHRMLVGAFLAWLAVLGDLWESCLKRNFHTKDSGSLLPGHGGVLDRFDSSFLAVLAYRYLTLRK